MDVHACMVCDQFLRRNHSVCSSLALISEELGAAATSSPPIQCGFASPDVGDDRSLTFLALD